MPKVKLAIVSTHPIQYYAPLFRALAESGNVQPRVFYTWSQTANGHIYDMGFSREVKWDLPLLDGYEHEFVENLARHPSSDRFWGIRNPDLTTRLLQWAPDAALIFGWRLHSHLQAIVRLAGRVPVLFRGDSTLLDEQPVIRGLLRGAMLRWVYRHIDLAIAVGQNNRDYFLKYGVSPDAIVIAPHAVDVDRFADAESGYDEQASRWRQELGIPEDQTVVLYAGKFQPKKDLSLLLSAFLQTRSAAHLVLFGGGELEQELRALARGHSHVHILPFQNQRTMPAVYRVGDLFVLPSRGPGETWGLSLNEAMACARPVIASSMVGGARDLVREGVSGWVFQAGCLEELVRVLDAALALGRSGLLLRGREAQRLSAAWSTAETGRKIAEAVGTFVEGLHGGVHAVAGRVEMGRSRTERARG